ncbi:hypothetical protein IAT38_001068 [Cryptococcus sp. DSM 104549]
MLQVATLFLLAPTLLARAAVAIDKRTSTAAVAGSATADVFPPPSTSVNSALFSGESDVGYAYTTPTGVEPAAIQTAASYASNTGASGQYPLVADQPSDADSDFDVMKSWGNLSPWYSVPSSFYGLDEASPLLPESCCLTQIHILYRHGARYPTVGSSPTAFAARLVNATAQEGGFTAKGELEFLNKWTYKLGAELLTPFGRLQEYELGVSFRQQYGVLLNNFTEQGTLPVFRTESQDRMVKTTQNFAAGFFGVPEFLDQVSIQLVVEAQGLNNSGAPYYACPNNNVPSRGSIGTSAYNDFTQNAYNSTLARLQKQLDGFDLLPTDVEAMLQLCAYETNALGYSSFCKLFTEEDFKNFDYAWDLSFYYSQGFGSPISAALGKAYLEEYVARLTNTPPTAGHSSLNGTLDFNSTFFPLNQSIYAAPRMRGPLPLDKRQEGSSFSTNKVVPFATHLVLQVMECGDMSPTKQARFIVNDAVIPAHESYEGCEWNKDGLCAFDTVVAALQKRIDGIDYEHDCYGNYTAEPGKDYNGRSPRS